MFRSCENSLLSVCGASCRLQVGKVTKNSCLCKKCGYDLRVAGAIGTDESVEVDVVVEERRKGDLWLACSDGLHGLVDDRQMRDALRQYAPEKAADVLLKAALDAGGRDNVTLVIVHDGEEPA